MDIIEDKIRVLSDTLSKTSDDDPRMPSLLESLGMLHSRRSDTQGGLQDLEKAIEYLSITLTLTPDHGPSLPRLLVNLGYLHMKRIKCLGLGEEADVGPAIEYSSLALALLPEGHPDLVAVLMNLGAAHSSRFGNLGELDDLNKAIEFKTRALALKPHDHPGMPGLLARIDDLRALHSDRFERLGQRADIEKAIEFGSWALSSTPGDHLDFPIRLGYLGVCRKDRYLCLGELGDLDLAIEYGTRALALTPDTYRDFPNQLNNLGVSYNYRFDHLGELADLEKAIEYGSRALALTPNGHRSLSSRLGNLAGSHRHRFDLLGEMNDLEKVIQYQTHVLALTPDGHPKLPRRFSNLGSAHSDRFKQLGELNDLDKAIEYETRAIRLTPNSHSDLPNLLANLGASYGDRHGCRGEQDDLNRGLELTSTAITLTADIHPSLPHMHYSLAFLRLREYCSTGDQSPLRHSLVSFRVASQSVSGSPRDKFRYALGWAKCACNHSSLNCIEAYQTSINLLPQFIWLGTTTAQRYQDLEQVQNLAVFAARAAIDHSEYELALEWLEDTRCVVWRQNLMLRSPLDELRSSDPSLADRLQTVAAQLHMAASESSHPQERPSCLLTTEQIAQKHHRLAKEYNDLIAGVRTIPGLKNFLLPKTAKDLVQVARNGPIVVINCHENGCDALAILPGEGTIKHIPLPNFSGEMAQFTRLELEKSIRSGKMEERGTPRRPVVEQAFDFQNILAILWYNIVKPILDFLGYTPVDSSGNLPHITWCPTGTLSFLPLHAAGDYDQPQSKVSNYVISSYTPTLSALLPSTPRSLNSYTKILAIGQANTPGHTSLPGTTKEVAYVESHTRDKAKYTQLLGHQATTTAVLDAMEQHDWVHLACHAHQNVQDPSKSSFFLHDGALKLEAINRRSLKNKGLAFLSACQTATGDKRLPNEAVHLASGMLMAGYSSVIATMWSIMDEDAPFIADKVYGQLMKDGKIGNGEAGKALHNAVAELRQKVGEEAFERWVPYIHIGS